MFLLVDFISVSCLIALHNWSFSNQRLKKFPPNLIALLVHNLMIKSQEKGEPKVCEKFPLNLISVAQFERHFDYWTYPKNRSRPIPDIGPSHRSLISIK